MLKELIAVFGKYIVIGFVLIVTTVLAIGIANAGELNETDSYPVSGMEDAMLGSYASGAYTATRAAIAIRFHELGVKRDAAYAMAGKCSGEITSVAQEAGRLLPKGATLANLSWMISFVMRDRCGLLKTTSS